MAYQESPLLVTAKGAAAGLAGTAALSAAMATLPKLVQRLSGQQAGGGEQEEPPTKLAGKVAEGVFDTGIREGTQQAAGQAIHWGYGAGWGAFYGIAQSSLKLPHLLHGTLFGSIVAVVASTVVPSMGLAPSPTKQPKTMSAVQFLMHLLYGWVVALTFRAISTEG